MTDRIRKRVKCFRGDNIRCMRYFRPMIQTQRTCPHPPLHPIPLKTQRPERYHHLTLRVPTNPPHLDQNLKAPALRRYQTLRYEYVD